MSCTRRETLRGMALLAAVESAEKTTDGGFAAVSLPGVPERGVSVLPPGALARRSFEAKCVGCQLCVKACPGDCLRASTRLKTFGQPEMDFRRGYCLTACSYRCAAACPAGALVFDGRIPREHLHVGVAVWSRERCIRVAEGVPCTACMRKCPVKAIHLVEGVPVVESAKCIGCGACEHVCPSRPLPAIHVKGYDVQHVVTPIGEADLVAEMRKLVASGLALVAAKDGVIFLRLEGHGIKPLVEALESHADDLRGALVYDKVVGRAAAAFYVRARPAKVFADVMADGAYAMLRENGIEAEAETRVKGIVNRDRTGQCPLEAAVSGLDDPKAMTERLRAFVSKP